MSKVKAKSKATIEKVIGAASEHVSHALFTQLGMNPEDPNFTNTPTRWVKYLIEFMKPFDAAECLETKFPLEKEGLDSHRPMVVQSNIPYEAICAHHLVPVLGRVHLGYVPGEYAVGLSKLTRLVQGIAHSAPSLQEDVGDKVADALQEHLGAAGAIVVIQAEHGCMACRGVTRSGIITSTSSVRGVFRDVPQARAEFFNLIASRRDL